MLEVIFKSIAKRTLKDYFYVVHGYAMYFYTKIHQTKISIFTMFDTMKEKRRE